LLKSESLLIAVTFRDDVDDLRGVVAQCENLACNQSRHFEIPLKKIGDKRFQANVNIPSHGVHRFKIRFQQRDTWYWDCRPFSYFIVDPDHLSDFRMYTYIPNVSGHFGCWVDDFRRIQDLGFNTIHLLPLTRMGSSESPYAAYDLFDIDPSFVDPSNQKTPRSQLEDLVLRAEKSGLHLCFDLVFNSIGLDSTIRQSRPEWLTEDSTEVDGIKRGGWSDGKKWHRWMDLAYINYDTPCSQSRLELWKYMSDYALYWSSLAAQTGGMIRLDNLHSSHESFVRRTLGEIREAYPEIITFGELFDTERRIEDLVLDYGLNFLLATPWEHKFAPQLRSYIKYLHGKQNRLRYLFPITSHDSGSPTEEFGDVRSTVPRLAVSTLFGPGPSGIVQGVEEGVFPKIKFIGRQGLVKSFGENDFSETIKALNALVQSDHAFQVAGNLIFIDHHHEAVLAACRQDTVTRDPRYLLFANMDIHGNQHITIDLNHYGLPLKGQKLTDVLTASSMTIDHPQFNLDLPPCGIRVFKVGR
jgi:hypothetical protein